MTLTTTNQAPYARPRVVLLKDSPPRTVGNGLRAIVSTLCVTVSVLSAAYKDLQSREDTRNGAWQQEGWDEVVYYTGMEGFGQLLQGPAQHAFTRVRIRTLRVQTLLLVFPVPLIQHMDSRIMIPTKASPLQ